jgi:signal transduction histidine kinase
MNLLVAQMLDAARLEDGRLPLTRDRLDLRDVAAEAFRVVRPLASAEHTLALETPPRQVIVFGDVDRLTTIVSNLLENAIKYSPEGGKVRCIVGAVEHTASVSVVDNGVGVAREDIPRLFNRFDRIRNPKTSHVAGTGLGLYLSRELARQHGGDIQVESRPAAGSTFTLTLPLAVPLHEAIENVSPPSEAAAPRLRVVPAEGESETRLA